MTATGKSQTFRSYSDPGHGWVKVPHALLAKLGIADKISHHSFTRGDYAYLEEDGDLSTFHNAMLANGITPRYVGTSTSDKSSKIRNYAHYSPKAQPAEISPIGENVTRPASQVIIFPPEGADLPPIYCV